MAGQVALRRAERLELPAPGVWEIDPAHSNIGFIARHLMVAKVRGRFRLRSGSVTIGATPADTSVAATIDASTVDTASEQRDGHLRSPDFLDVENFPTLDFRSTKVERVGDTSLTMRGELTIRGITKPVRLDVEFDGLTTDPFGNPRAVFSADTEIDREEWGMTWNQALESGGVLVGKRVKIQLEIEAVRKP